MARVYHGVSGTAKWRSAANSVVQAPKTRDYIFCWSTGGEKVVRLLHSSDWQMGLRAVHAGTKAKEIREKRFESASRVADSAKEHGVDFVILAGDIFEHHDVDEVIVKRTIDVLNRFAPIPVYILPGNHDPYVPGGVWKRQSWTRAGPHVTLCAERKQLAIGNSVSLFPCPLLQKRSNLDPTDWIPTRDAGDTHIRIGVAHGALDLLPETANFPIRKDRAELCGLDYLALGDWHGFLQHGKAVYSGTMEPTSFSEREPGYVVVVEIANPGEVPKLERIRTRSLTWAEFNREIRDITDVETLDTDLKAIGPFDSLVLRIAPTIQTGADEVTLQRLEVLEAELEGRAFLLEWVQDSSGLLGRESSTHLPDGVLQRVDEAMSAIIEGRTPESAGQVFAKQAPEEFREARALLHRLARKEAT